MSETVIVQKVTELLWLATERDYLTFKEVHEAFPVDKLLPDEMAAVCRMLEEAGVKLIDASEAGLPPSTVRSPANDSVSRKLQSEAVGNYLRQMAGEQPLVQHVEGTPARRMEAADGEMRQIICTFGFAANQHLVRAEKLLGSPSAERLDQMLASSTTRSRNQYLKDLPGLIKRVRTLDHQTAAAYREWRQAADGTTGGERLAEFRKLDRELQKTFPDFHYHLSVIQQMIAMAENFAVQFRAGQRAQEPVPRGRDPVGRLPLADVERQAIEAMEEFVRMPCEEFLRSYTRLKAAEAEFLQARAQLIHDHLPLVAAIAGVYHTENLALARLLRVGLSALLSAVEKYEYRHAWKFSTYASSWIRQSMRDALAEQSRKQETEPAGKAATA